MSQPKLQPKILAALGLTPIWVRRNAAPAPCSTQPSVTAHAPSLLSALPVLNEGAEKALPNVGQQPTHELSSFSTTLTSSHADVPITELDWGALKERVSHCTHCKLCETRTQTVFGVGDQQADWMLIGEAPGANEDKQGEPFVGQAGKLLDNMLHAVGRARGEGVYIANVIKCRPPGNRDPHPDEIAKCEPYLQRQLALIRPKLIIALGRFAAQSLLKTQASIASMRSRVHEYEGVPVIITYHPAYLLRNMPDKAKAWADLCFAQQTYQEITA